MRTYKITTVSLKNKWSGTIIDRDTSSKLTEHDLCYTPDAQQWDAFFQQLIQDPASLSGYAVLKYSQAGEVIQAECETSDGSIIVICKQSRPVGLMKKLSQMGRATREKKNFHRALDLDRAGISTAWPLAYIECQNKKRYAWLVTEYLPDLIDLDQWLSSLSSIKDRSELYRSKKRITQLVAALFVNFKKQGWHHRDLKASNLLVQKSPATHEPSAIFLVDLDGLNKPRWWTSKKRYQPLVRLAASLHGHATVTSTDSLRFLKTYLRLTDSSLSTNKSLVRSLARSVNRYVKRSVGRKTHKLDGYAGDLADSSA